MEDVFAKGDDSQAEHRTRTRMLYEARLDAAKAGGHNCAITAVIAGEAFAWSCSPDDVAVDGDRIAFPTAEGVLTIAFAGPDAPAMLPSIEVMDESRRRCEAARREIRRMTSEDDGARMLLVTDGRDSEHVAPAYVMVNCIGMFPPRVLGVAWDETRTLRVEDEILVATTDERTLSASAAA